MRSPALGWGRHQVPFHIVGFYQSFQFFNSGFLNLQLVVRLDQQAFKETDFVPQLG